MDDPLGHEVTVTVSVSPPVDLFLSGTYSHDRPLFERLGLRTFSHAGTDWLDVGTVELETASVKVEVYCAPAQFWRFTISPKAEDVQAGVLSTGSGTLGEYWPVVVQWATGLLGFQGFAVGARIE